MKVFDVLPPTSLNTISEGKKKKQRKIPVWAKGATFRKGPYGIGGFWGGWHAWGGNDSGDGDGGGGDGGGGE